MGPLSPKLNKKWKKIKDSIKPLKISPGEKNNDENIPQSPTPSPQTTTSTTALPLSPLKTNVEKEKIENKPKLLKSMEKIILPSYEDLENEFSSSSSPSSPSTINCSETFEMSSISSIPPPINIEMTDLDDISPKNDNKKRKLLEEIKNSETPEIISPLDILEKAKEEKEDSHITVSHKWLNQTFVSKKEFQNLQ